MFVVHAYNGLEGFAYGTSLHTHGMMFNNSNWYDGAVSTTQCAIPFGETLDYYIDTTLNTGTYWIHGHHMGQYVDGLRARQSSTPPSLLGVLMSSRYYPRQRDSL